MEYSQEINANSRDLKTKGNISSLKKILYYLQPYKIQYIGVIIALIFSSSSVLSIGYGLRYLVDQGLHSNDTSLLNYSLVILLCIISILALSTYARYYLITWVGEKIIADIRYDVFNHILHLSPRFFETMKVGEILSRLTTDTTLLQIVVGSSLSVAMRNSLMLIGGIILLIISSPKLFLVISFIVPIVVGIIVIIGKKVRYYSRKSQDAIAMLSSGAEESLNRLKIIQAYTRENYEASSFYKYINDSLDIAVKRIRLRAMLTALVIILIFFSVAIIIWFGGNEVLSGNMSAGELSSFIFYAILVAGSTGAISEVIGDLQRAAGATERIFELLDQKSDIVNIDNPVIIKDNINYPIIFENITFNYPARPQIPALKNFTLTINSGETIAIVGPSGAGKSTIIQLLLRFYDPQNGSIKIANYDIRNIALDSLRKQFALVSQDSVIFSGTVYENIIYGDLDATDSMIKNAAELAAASEFIQDLPKQFQSYIGEKGVRLSGGQKQRLSIARAILRNAKILLLDEATSSLDSHNEQLVQESFEQLMKNKTTIVIAHRLSTVLSADRIVVLDNGQIQDIGTHYELLERCDLYSNLARIQFRG